MTTKLLPILQKPDYGKPCNHCGLCCMTITCDFAVAVGETEAPCKFLEPRGDEFYCGLTRIASPEHRAFMGFRLGFGVGCDSEIAEYKQDYSKQAAQRRHWTLLRRLAKQLVKGHERGER